MRRFFVALALAAVTWAAPSGRVGARGSPGNAKGMCDWAKLPGLWTSASYSIRIARDGSYEAAGAPNVMTIDVTGQLTADACTIRFVDKDGFYACPASQVGTYRFTVRDTSLKFTLVSDACDGRRLAMSGATLTRSATPAR